MSLSSRLRNAWTAFKKNNAQIGSVTFGVDVKKCSECDKANSHLVAYICDRKQCNNCSFPECRHTFDINHAANFINVIDNVWGERDI